VIDNLNLSKLLTFNDDHAGDLALSKIVCIWKL